MDRFDELEAALVDHGFDKHEADIADTFAYAIETRLPEHLLASRTAFPRDVSCLAEFADACRRLEVRVVSKEHAVKPAIVANYLRHLILKGRSREEVILAAASIDAAHEVFQHSLPSSSPFVRAALKFNHLHPRQETPADDSAEKDAQPTS